MHSLKGPPSSPNTSQLQVGSRCDHRENLPDIPSPPPGGTQCRHAPRRGSGRKFCFRDSETALHHSASRS